MSNKPAAKEMCFQQFSSFIAERWKSNDWEGYIRRGILNRTEMHKECGFARSTFQTNDDIVKLLNETEDKLRELEILPAVDDLEEKDVVNANTNQNSSYSIKDKRLNALEQQNALLQAENNMLKEMLSKYELMDKYLQESGRLVRP